MNSKDRLRLEAILNGEFTGRTLSARTEAILDKYVQASVMLDHAETLEDFDYWSIRKEVGEVRAWR